MCVMLVMEGGCGGAGNAADTPSTTISGVAVAFAAVIGTATLQMVLKEQPRWMLLLHFQISS